MTSECSFEGKAALRVTPISFVEMQIQGAYRRRFGAPRGSLTVFHFSRIEVVDDKELRRG